MAKDAKVRAKAKTMYEAGLSLRVIAAELDITFQTVQFWSKKEGWTKGKNKSKLEQIENAATERAAEKEGLTKAKVSAKILSLMEAKKGIYSQGVLMTEVSDNGAQVAATSLAADVLGMKKIQIDPTDEFRSFFGSLRAGTK